MGYSVKYYITFEKVYMIHTLVIVGILRITPDSSMYRCIDAKQTGRFKYTLISTA
jgi:hypothetical protein